MAEIKTNLREKLSNILSLISKIKFIGTTFKLVPTIDYHKVMEESYPLHANTIAGNVDTEITPSSGYKLLLRSISITLICDATVANRFVRLYFLDQNSEVPAYIQFKTAVTAGNTGVKDLSPFSGDIQETGQEWATLHFPYPIFDTEILKIEISNGQAGDEYEYALISTRHKSGND